MIFNREPALIVGAVNAVVAVAVGFGLNVTPEQVGLVNAAVAAVLSVVVRQNVTPARNARPLRADGVTFVEVCVGLIALVVVLWAVGVDLPLGQ